MVNLVTAKVDFASSSPRDFLLCEKWQADCAELVHAQFNVNQQGKQMLNTCRDIYESMYRSGEGGGMPAM